MANLDQIMDYLADNSIAEQGTDGDWTYRKWSDGTAECWAKVSSTFAPTNTASPINYRLLTKTLPTGLFYTAMEAFVDIYWGSGVSWASARQLSTSEVGYSVYKLSSGSENADIYFHVIGTWK